jgi:hypothetical protein
MQRASAATPPPAPAVVATVTASVVKQTGHMGTTSFEETLRAGRAARE